MCSDYDQTIYYTDHEVVRAMRYLVTQAIPTPVQCCIDENEIHITKSLPTEGGPTHFSSKKNKKTKTKKKQQKTLRPKPGCS